MVVIVFFLCSHHRLVAISLVGENFTLLSNCAMLRTMPYIIYLRTNNYDSIILNILITVSFTSIVINLRVSHYYMKAASYNAHRRLMVLTFLHLLLDFQNAFFQDTKINLYDGITGITCDTT